MPIRIPRPATRVLVNRHLPRGILAQRPFLKGASFLRWSPGRQKQAKASILSKNFVVEPAAIA